MMSSHIFFALFVEFDEIRKPARLRSFRDAREFHLLYALPIFLFQDCLLVQLFDGAYTQSLSLSAAYVCWLLVVGCFNCGCSFIVIWPCVDIKAAQFALCVYAFLFLSMLFACH